jgi:hypothetical protein
MHYDLTRFHRHILRRGRSSRAGLPSHEESRRDLDAVRAPLYGVETAGRLFN